jgi:predicted transglutaminase-like cysteine proteinase
MNLSGFSHAWRVGMVACALAWFGPAELRADTRVALGPVQVIQRSAEPFGLAASPLGGGGLRDKWLGVQHRLDDELVQLALCDGDRDGCVSPAALKFLAIIDAAKLRDGRARLGEVNHAVNLAIRPISDLAQYGQADVWTSPLATLAKGGGDCEDYAIAKFVALRLAGVAPDDLRIVIMHDTIRGEDHAVAAARLDGRWLTLDNNRMAMVEDINVRNYRPTFLIDQHAVMRYADPAQFADATGRSPYGSKLASPLVVSSLAEPGQITSANETSPQAD